MAPILVRVSLAGTSGLATDVAVNDFALISNVDLTDTVADDIVNDIDNGFYNYDGGSGSLASLYLSPKISRATNACTAAMYDITGALGGGPIGSPGQVRNFTLDALGTGNPLPSEVAVVTTIHGDLTDVPETAVNPSPPPAFIRPAARLRGRLFIGPLATTASTTGTSDAVPVSGLITLLNAAAENLNAALADPDDHGQWAVWSRSSAELNSVVGGWTDNAFDTMRSRGRDATARTVWP